MSYTPENNPYIPGDPYSYDLKWMVKDIKHMEERFGELDSQVQEATDQADRSRDEADRSRDEADRSDTEALKSEGFAVGEQDGAAVDPDSPYYENNAKFYAEKAQIDGHAEVLKSEGFAIGEQEGTPVGSGSPYYENNSKYFAQEAAASEQAAADYAAHIADPVSGIVTTWLNDHITQPTTPPIDTSLTVANAAADAKAAGDAIRALSDTVQDNIPYIETVQQGFLQPDGTYLGPTFLSITRKYAVKENDVFLYRGIGDGSAAEVIFMTDDTIVSYLSGYNAYAPRLVTVPASVNRVIFSSFLNNISDASLIPFEVVKLNSADYQNERRVNAALRFDTALYTANTTTYLQPNGKLASGGNFPSIIKGYDVENIKRFVFRGYGTGSAAVCLKVNAGSIVSTVTGDYTTDSLEIVPDGTFDSIVFASFSSGNNNIIFELFIEYDYQDELSYPYEETKQPGFLEADGSYAGTTNFISITRRYHVIPGDTIKYKGIGDGTAVTAIFYDGSGNILSTDSGKYLTVLHDITVPAGAVTALISSFGNGNDYNNVYLYSAYNVKTIRTEIDEIKTSFVNILSGKKWAACGDSFTDGSFDDYIDSEGHSGTASDAYDKQWRMYKTYPWWIARRNNMQLVMNAVSGSPMAITRAHIQDPDTYPIDYQSPFSYQRYQSLPADVDYITLWFGINDSAKCTIGTINDATNETTYGAWNVVMEYLIRNHPWAKIGIIVTDAIPPDRPGFAQVAKDIARKWGVGYLDLQYDYQVPLVLDVIGKPEVSPVAAALRNAQYYVSNDNHHPSLKAHEQMSSFIENWMRSL